MTIINRGSLLPDPFNAIRNAFVQSKMSGKLFFIVAVALLASVGTASAKNPVTLTDAQLDKVIAGAANFQIPVNSAARANGRNGPGRVNPPQQNGPCRSGPEIRQDGFILL